MNNYDRVMHSKIIDQKNVIPFISQFDRSKEKLVFTNGCFDVIHYGHIKYLAHAKSLGTKLIIGVNTDESIKRLKGEKNPINPLAMRLEVLAALFFVDFVIPFSEDTPISLIQIIKPDIHVKGGDYTAELLPEYSVVKSYGGEIKIIAFIEGFSSSKIVKKIQELDNV